MRQQKNAELLLITTLIRMLDNHTLLQNVRLKNTYSLKNSLYCNIIIKGYIGGKRTFSDGRQPNNQDTVKKKSGSIYAHEFLKLYVIC